MKKLMIMLLMVVATSTASFAKGSNDNVQTAVKEVIQKVNSPHSCDLFSRHKHISVYSETYVPLRPNICFTIDRSS